MTYHSSVVRAGLFRINQIVLPLLVFLAAHRSHASEKIAIKVIVLSGFEVGDDTGDAPGEFQYWAEREHLTGTLEVTGAPHPLRYNAAGLYASVAGNTRDRTLTTVPASELIMALALDPQLDLRKTYWIINGISGIDPAHGPIGSAVWAGHVIDGDAMREVGEAEMPANWTYGLFAIGTSAPNTLPPAHADAGGWGGATLAYTMDYALNPGLTRWAFELSNAKATLPDSPELKAWRMQYTGYPKAQLPPQILMGDTLSSARYWHGEKRTVWARDWVKLWTAGKGEFSTTAMEQAAYVGTLQRMAAKGLLDFNRVLMLRSASNYCTPPAGQDFLKTIGDESLGTAPAFEAAYRAGSVVVHELLQNWTRYEAEVPKK
jgi:purine nucleoside permease